MAHSNFAVSKLTLDIYKFPKVVFVGHMYPNKINKLCKAHVLIYNLNFFSNTCFKNVFKGL